MLVFIRGNEICARVIRVRVHEIRARIRSCSWDSCSCSFVFVRFAFMFIRVLEIRARVRWCSWELCQHHQNYWCWHTGETKPSEAQSSPSREVRREHEKGGKRRREHEEAEGDFGITDNVSTSQEIFWSVEDIDVFCKCSGVGKEKKSTEFLFSNTEIYFILNERDPVSYNNRD